MVAWMEPYYGRFRDPTLIKCMRKFRLLKHTRQGGNLTLLFGVKEMTVE